MNQSLTERKIWLGLFLAVLAGCAWVEPFEKGFFSLCVFNSTTGLPCPGCGLTRSFVWLIHGDLARSLEFNPFGIVILAGWTWKSITDGYFLATGRLVRLLSDRANLTLRKTFVMVFLGFGMIRIFFHMNELILFRDLNHWIASLN